MVGAIIGDIIGSPYEFNNIKTTEFKLFSCKSHFTDDTVLTIAICDAILKKKPFSDCLFDWANRFPDAGYGGRFLQWMNEENKEPYGSFGNGSAMRVSSVGWLFESLNEIVAMAEQSAMATHNHPEGIKGAVAVASVIYLSRTGKSKDYIASMVKNEYEYDLSRPIQEIREMNSFDETCQGSVPEAISCFLQSDDFVSAIRLAVSIGGDSDTITNMTGAMAEAFYQDIPFHIICHTVKRLPYDMWQILYEFHKKTKNKNRCTHSFFFEWENLIRNI